MSTTAHQLSDGNLLR